MNSDAYIHGRTPPVKVLTLAPSPHIVGPVPGPIGTLAPARRGIAVIEAAYQAHGAAYRGRPAGSMGAATAFSLYPGKNLGALGDGGAVTTNDPRIADEVALAA